MPSKETALLGELNPKLRQFASNNQVNLNDIPDDLWLILTDKTTDNLNKRPLAPGVNPERWIQTNQETAEIYEEKQLALLQTWHQGNLDPEYVEMAFGPGNSWSRLFFTINTNQPLILRPRTAAEMNSEFNLKFPDLAIGLTVEPYPEPVRLDLNSGQSVLAITDDKVKLQNQIQTAAAIIKTRVHLDPEEKYAEQIYQTVLHRQTLLPPQLVILTQPLAQINQLIALVDAAEFHPAGLTLVTLFSPVDWQRQLAAKDLQMLTRSLESADLVLHLSSQTMLVAPNGAAPFPAWQLKNS